MWITLSQPFCLLRCLNILIEFIGVKLVTKLYRYQVYHSIIHHVYIILCVHHPSQVSFHHHLPASTLCYLPRPLSFRESPCCCVYQSWFVCFFCLVLSLFSPDPQPSLPSNSCHLFSVSVSLFLFCQLILSIRFHM